MESFPFDEYHFELEELGNSAERLGINPIIIEAAGSIVEPSLVNFTKHGEIVNISLSFYTYDIEYIYDKAETVKKMDDLSLILNNAVKCKNFKDKLIAIKEGKKFLKKIGSSSAVNGNFNKMKPISPSRTQTFSHSENELENKTFIMHPSQSRN